MKSKENEKFIYEHDSVPTGYYDRVYKMKKGIQSKWHDQKFNFVKKKMKNYNNKIRNIVTVTLNVTSINKYF